MTDSRLLRPPSSPGDTFPPRREGWPPGQNTAGRHSSCWRLSGPAGPGCSLELSGKGRGGLTTGELLLVQQKPVIVVGDFSSRDHSRGEVDHVEEAGGEGGRRQFGGIAVGDGGHRKCRADEGVYSQTLPVVDKLSTGILFISVYGYLFTVHVTHFLGIPKVLEIGDIGPADGGHLGTDPADEMGDDPAETTGDLKR